MIPLKSGLQALILPLFLLAGSCTNDPDGGAKPPGPGITYGSFQVSLVQPVLGASQGYTSVVGKLYNGPTPSPLNWKEEAKSGSCTLLKPSAPFCETPCGSTATCVAANKCQAFPKSIGVGRVTVEGIKSRAGDMTFTMDPLNNGYQPAAGVILALPPFSEGDAVKFTAAGDTAAAAFSITAKGISSLHLLNDTLTLADGKAVSLKWTAPADPSLSTISVMVDISHHGGTKGKIECEGPDNGTMEIAAGLVDELKALGVSGFPKLEMARRAVGTSASVEAKVILESQVTMPLNIPGLISCTPGSEDEKCPDGLTCQPDLQCK